MKNNGGGHKNNERRCRAGKGNKERGKEEWRNVECSEGEGWRGKEEL